MGKTKTAEGEKKIMPLISVIMGVHNSDPDMLLSAVGSVLSQSVSDIELIICDDGSENDIEKILDSIKDSREVDFLQGKQRTCGGSQFLY